MQEYDKWNEQKKIIDTTKNSFIFKVREIYWVKVGKNIGYEVYGKGDEFLRPVLVLRKFSKDTFIGIPLTSANKNDMFHYKFSPLNNNKINYAILSQIKMFSAKRIHDKMGKISNDDFIELKNKLKGLLEL